MYQYSDGVGILCVVKSGALNIKSALFGHGVIVCGFQMLSDLVGRFGRNCRQFTFPEQTLNRTTVCRLPLDRLREAQLKRPTLTKDLLQDHRNQAAQTQCHITRVNFLAIAYFSRSTIDVDSYHRKKHISGCEFDQRIARPVIADCLRLATETISRLIASLTNKGVLETKKKAVCILDKQAPKNACKTLGR